MSDTEEICTCPVCGRLHRYLAANPPPVISGEAVIIPRAQYDALMAAAKAWIKENKTQADDSCACDWCQSRRDIFGTLRAAGIQTEKT
jgi:hypothetical protein